MRNRAVLYLYKEERKQPCLNFYSDIVWEVLVIDQSVKLDISEKLRQENVPKRKYGRALFTLSLL